MNISPTMENPKYMLRRLGYAPNSTLYLTFKLNVGTNLLGRQDEITAEADYQLPIDSYYCSRNHCWITVDPDQKHMELCDTSTNGTYVNDALVLRDTVDLKLGDVIMIGYKLNEGIPLDRQHYSFKVEYFCDVTIKEEPVDETLETEVTQHLSTAQVQWPVIIDEVDENELNARTNKLSISVQIDINGVEFLNETRIQHLKESIFESCTRAIQAEGEDKPNLNGKNPRRKCPQGCHCGKHHHQRNNKSSYHQASGSKVSFFKKTIAKSRDYAQCPLCAKILGYQGLREHLKQFRCKKLKKN